MLWTHLDLYLGHTYERPLIFVAWNILLSVLYFHLYLSLVTFSNHP